MVMVVGIADPVMPGVAAWLVVVVTVPGPHWPLAHDVDLLVHGQQVLHPTAPNSTRLATPAACKSFFMSRSPVSCPPVANPRRFPTFGFRSARLRRVCRVYRLFRGPAPAN